MPEEAVIDKPETTDGLPSGSPRNLMKNWMAGVDKLMADPVPDPKPKDTSGKTTAPERSADVAPATEPPVGTAPADKGPDSAQGAAGDDPGGKPSADAKPASEASADPKKEPEKADWETAPAPKGAKEWDKWKEGRRNAETKLKQEIQSRESKVKELETKLTELESKASTAPETDPATKAQLERLESENKQLTESIMRLRVTEHPKFKAHYQAPIDDAIAEAKTIVGEEHAATVEKILKMDDNEFRKNQLDEFLSNFDDEGVKTDIRGIVRDIRKVHIDRDKEIKRVEAHNATLSAQEQAAAKTKADSEQKARETAYLNTVKALTDPAKGFLPFQKRDGDEAWNEGVQKRLDAAKGLLLGQNLTADQIVQAAHWAVALPAVVQMHEAAAESWKAEKAKYEAQIAELSKAQPAGGSGAPKEQASDKIKLNKNMKPWQVSKSWAEAAHAMTQE